MTKNDVSLSRRQFREQLLPPTLKHAFEHSSYYRDLYNLRDVGSIARIEDLRRLPVLSRSAVQDNLSSLLVRRSPVAMVQQTTGTGGRALPIYKSHSEITFIREFFGKTLSNLAERQRTLTLTLVDAYHGRPLEVPANVFPLHVGMTDDIHAKEARRILETEFDIANTERRVSVLIGLVPYLKTLTQYLVDTGFNFKACGVKVICPICTIITPRWRQILETTWGAQVAERYSLSEVFGGATRNPRTTTYLFDPVVIPEVVDPFSERPIVAGMGVLLLTTLFPFVEMQPLIRYRTDDLVTVTKWDGDAGEPHVAFKGRLANAPIVEVDGKARVLFAPSDVYEALDSIPDIETSDRFLDMRQLSDKTVAGSLAFSATVESRDSRIYLTITVGLRYSPNLYPGRVQELEKQIREKMVSVCDPIKDGSCALSIFFAGPKQVLPHALKV